MKFTLIACIVILGSSIATAQDGDMIKNRYGYAFGGIFTVDESYLNLSAGAGVEYRLFRGLAMNTEISYVAPILHATYGFGVWNVNGSYHFDKVKSTPFITAGYSMIFRENAVHLFNIGGGIQRRLKSGRVLRLELRDHIVWGFGAHLIGFRVGGSF